jgi:hypothetical protein
MSQEVTDVTGTIHRYCNKHGLTPLGDVQLVAVPGQRTTYRLRILDKDGNIKHLNVRELTDRMEYRV